MKIYFGDFNSFEYHKFCIESFIDFQDNVENIKKDILQLLIFIFF